MMLAFLFILSISIYGYQRLENNLVYPTAAAAVQAEFLSDAYFTELKQQYDQIRSNHRKWHKLDQSKTVAARAILTRMMNDLTENPDLLLHHHHFDLFFDTLDRYVRQLPYLPEELHYFRNELNRYGQAPERLDDMIKLAASGKWRLFSARYHRYEVDEYDAAYNVKFVSADGRFEEVYNIQTGQLVTDPVNMGTYNYAPGSYHPWKYFQHNKYDKTPWKKWGNTSEVSYEEINERSTRHGTIEQQKSALELQKLIEKKKRELQAQTS